MADGCGSLSSAAMAAPGSIAGTVEGVMNYLSPIRSKPHTYNYEPPAGVPKQNFGTDARRVAISDLRGREGEFTLDRNGFAALRHRSREFAFEDDAAIREFYYAESEALLTALLGDVRVLTFDHTIRRRIPGQPDHTAGGRQPVARVHVDQTDKSGVERVRRHLSAEAERLLGGRVRIINLWRPIIGPVLDHPLAMADGASIAAEDLVATDLLYPNHTGETYSVTFNPEHRWHYWSAMQPDEVLLLKCYDSVQDIPARLSPHSAFADPRTVDRAPPRQSIELRALVFGG